MSERLNSMRDIAHLAIAAVDTAGIATAIKFLYGNPGEISFFLRNIFSDHPFRESLLFKATEIGLSSPFLGALGGAFTVSLIEELRSLNIFRGIAEYFRSRQDSNFLSNLVVVSFKPLEETFGEIHPLIRATSRISRKGALAGAALGFAGGMGTSIMWSIPLYAMNSDVQQILWFTETAGLWLGSVFAFYGARKFAYQVNNK